MKFIRKKYLNDFYLKWIFWLVYMVYFFVIYEVWSNFYGNFMWGIISYDVIKMEMLLSFIIVLVW